MTAILQAASQRKPSRLGERPPRMGLMHSRASKKRDKAEAKLLEEQRKQVRDERRREDRERREEAAGDNPWRQPTLGGAIRKATENRRKAGEGQED